MKMITGWARLAPDARGGVVIGHFLYRRREFILFLGAAAVILPLAARAQRSERIRRIGVIMGGTEENDPESQARITAFKEGLAALGWTEGRNIRIDYRFGGGDPDRIGNIVAELVRSGPDLIVANTTAATAALKQATNTIPVVFAVVNDPVGQGLISSLARPGGNITGFTYADFALLGKWLEMLKQIAPGVRKAILLFNPETVPFYPVFLRELGEVPSRLGAELAAAPIREEIEIETVVAKLGSEGGGGLIAAGDPFVLAHRELIISLAERYRLPAVYYSRQFAAEGGLISYGPDIHDVFRRSTSYVDRILKGTNPADLPVQAPMKFELVINLRTAKALGLEVPLHLQQLADEVIE
jgi:putative tryptophan/tyrosine transport system substrate-binding protein